MSRHSSPAEHARHEIQRERPFVRRPAAAAGLERDPLLHEDRIAPAARLDQPLGAEPRAAPRRARAPSAAASRRARTARRGTAPAGGTPSIGVCLHSRAHHRILPRSVRHRLRRMDETAGRAVRSCHRPTARTGWLPLSSGQRPCAWKYSPRPASSCARSRSPRRRSGTASSGSRSARPALTMLAPPSRSVSLPNAMITSAARSRPPPAARSGCRSTATR